MNSQQLYIELLKRAVQNHMYRPRWSAPVHGPEQLARARQHIEHLRRQFGAATASLALTPESVCDMWFNMTPHGHTLCDLEQLNNVQYCVEYALKHAVPGHLIETGVFRGGQCIFMRGLLKAHGVSDRKVFVADSFEGLPVPDGEKSIHDAIAYEFLKHFDSYAVDVDTVRENFSRYDLLDENVVFLKGWFKDTLPTAPIDRLSVMRLDGDFYDSTMEALESLYPRLSPGGFAIIDDYGLPVGCAQAVDEYRNRCMIRAPLRWVNDRTVYWQKP